MASSQSQQVNNTAPSGLVKPTGDNIDEAWQWNSLKDINNKRSVTCDFCNKTTNGGITRARNHQMGLRGNVGACTKIPQETKLKLKENYEKKKAENNADLFEVNEDDDEQDEVQEIHNIRAGKGAEVAAPAAKKGKSVKGPLDLLYSRAPPPGAASKSRQTSINDKEARSRAVQYIARWFYKCSIPFNAMRDKSFKLMMDAVGNYGPNLKLPSYHELRVPLLKKELALTIEMLQPRMVERANSGCSIMSDAWTDRKNRTLINFMVNTPRGTMFVKSIDASGYVKSGQKIYELLDAFVTDVGEENVVQVITDNGSNYVLAGRKLEARRHRLFWTPCAAHCIDLMLEDIGKLPRLKKACQRGVTLVSFIYNHTMTLKDIDMCNEWLTGELVDDEAIGAEDELVFEDETLTWGDVANVAGVGEPERLTRRQQTMRNQAAPIEEEEEDVEQIAHDDNEEELEDDGDEEELEDDEDDDEETLGDSDSI